MTDSMPRLTTLSGWRWCLPVLILRGSTRAGFPFPNPRSQGGSASPWAPGKHILYQRLRNFHLLDPETEAEEFLVTNDSAGFMFGPHYSPNGESVAVSWMRKEWGTWVISLRDSSETLVYPGRFAPVGWTADGTSLYVQEYFTSDDILLVPARGGEAKVVARIPFESAECVPVERPVGLALLCNVREAVSDAWMIENFDPAIR